MWENILEETQQRMVGELSLDKVQEAHCWQVLSDLADAILEVLKASGFFSDDWTSCIYEGWLEDQINTIGTRGTLVFIPDE